MPGIKLFLKKLFRRQPKTSVYSIQNYLFLRKRHAISCSFIEFQQLEKQTINFLIDVENERIASISKIKKELKNKYNCDLCHNEQFIQDKTVSTDEGDYKEVPCPRCNPRGDGS